MNVNNIILNETRGITQHPDYKTDIAEILRGNLTPRLIQEKIQSFHGKDIADALEMLQKGDRMKTYRCRDTGIWENVLEYTKHISTYLSELSFRKKMDVISQMEITTAAEALRRTEKADKALLVELLDPDFRREIAVLNPFDDDEIGNVLSTNYVSIRIGYGVRDAMRERIQQ